MIIDCPLSDILARRTILASRSESRNRDWAFALSSGRGCVRPTSITRVGQGSRPGLIMRSLMFSINEHRNFLVLFSHSFQTALNWAADAECSRSTSLSCVLSMASKRSSTVVKGAAVSMMRWKASCMENRSLGWETSSVGGTGIPPMVLMMLTGSSTIDGCEGRRSVGDPCCNATCLPFWVRRKYRVLRLWHLPL